MAWATVAETLTYTGLSVSSNNVEAAQAIIEMFADVTEDSNGNIGTKNLRLLKLAVSYQAAWMSDHPDLFTHVDVRTMLQDGVQFTNMHANSGVLAPLAKRALDRLSWKRNRNIKIRPRNRISKDGRYRIGYFGNTAEQDDNVMWYDL